MDKKIIVVYQPIDEKFRRKTSEYEIGRFVYLPNTKPYFFEVILRYEAVSKVGILASILDEFRERDIPILQLKVSSPYPEKPIRILLATDMKGREHMLPEILSRISRVDDVIEVNYAEPLFDSVAVDIWSFPPTFQGQRVVFIREGVFEGMLREGWSRLGSGFGSLLYYSFYHGVRKIFEDFYSKVVSSRREAVKLAKELFRMFGYGLLEVIKLTEEEAILRVYDSFECKILREAGEPRGAIIRGMIAGWLSGLWDAKLEEMEVIEARCIARGDKYCEYYIRRRT